MTSIRRSCSIENCLKPMFCKSYCSMHYQRVHKSGSTEANHREQHGMTSTPVYNSWIGIKNRTGNPNTEKYSIYGGRGIRMCQRWKISLLEFYKDVGDRPTPDHSIDRKDVDGNYSCGKCEECITNNWSANCRWATRRVQMWNTHIRKNNTSGYRGLKRVGNKWQACLRVYYGDTNEEFRVGRYDTKEEAAIAYDQAAIFFRGEHAVTNIL